MPFLAAAGPALGAIGSVVGIASGLKGLFGGSGSPNVNIPDPFRTPRRTPYSSIGGGLVNLDPTIRTLRRQTLQHLPEYRSALTGAYGDYASSLGGIREGLLASANPFIQARVNPLLERGARARGELVSGLSRRGIFGPLYQQSLSGFETDLSRAEADQRALATRENLDALLGVDAGRYNAALSSVQALLGLDQAQQAVVAGDLQQELASLGLTADDINAAMQAAGLNLQQAQLQDATRGRGMFVLGQSLSDLSKNPILDRFSFGGGLASGARANPLGLTPFVT